MNLFKFKACTYLFLYRPFKRTAVSAVSLLVVAALLQTLCATYFLSIKGFAAVASILFIVCQLASCVCLLHLPPVRFKRVTFINHQTTPKLLVVAALLPLSYSLARGIMDGTPLRIEYADMLPIIGVMCRRLLSGRARQVYTPVPEIWNGIQPVYLPAVWLPFCASFLLHFDMRWITVACIWCCILLCSLPVWKRTGLIPFYTAALLLLLTWLHLEKTNNVIRLTEEGVVFFYYSLLTVAVLVNRAWLVGMAAALCLLSRYAVIGWLPFAVLCLLYKKQYRFLGQAVLAGGLATALLILPFGTAFLQHQLRLPYRYVAHAQRVWQENPAFFQQSPGLAKFFGPAHGGWLHGLLVWGTFAVPLLFFLLIYKKAFPTVNLLLAGLQLTLCFFYAFLDVSYLYLFYTPVFVSLVAAGWVMSVPKNGQPV